MKLSPARGISAALLLCLPALAGATDVSSVSLQQAAKDASQIDVQQSAGEGAAIARMRVQHFADGDQRISWDDNDVLMLCGKVGYIKVPADKPEVARLPVEQRQMIVYSAMMSSIGGLLGVMQASGDAVDVAADGSERRRIGESRWAYGLERSEVTSQRMPDGALRVRSRKTETVNTTAPHSPGDVVSTEEDQAARLAELPAVGSWFEVLISTAPKQARIDPALSLKGWVSSGDGHAATVGKARTAAGCE